MMPKKEKMKKLKIRKKAQLFTLIAIMLIILTFVSYEIFLIISEREAVMTRVKTMNSFLFSLEQDISRKMYIIGYRTIFISLNRITKTGEYIPSADDLLKEAFFNGTAYNENSEVFVGATYNDLINNINGKASKINVNINISNASIEFSQEDPWNIVVLFRANLIMADKTGIASWNKQEEIKAYIKVEGFEDPFYIVNTNALVINKINRTIFEGDYVQGSDTTNLQSHVNLGFYSSNENAPSFLNKLEGNFSPNAYGIESLVNLNRMSQQGIAIKEKSVVDFIYFSSNNPANCKIQNMPDWFKLDDSHLAKYNSTCQ